MTIGVDIPRLLADLHAISSHDDGDTSRDHIRYLQELCRRAELALRQQEAEHRKAHHELGRGFIRLGQILVQDNA